MGKSHGTTAEGFVLSKHVDDVDLFDASTITYDLFMRLLFSLSGDKRGGDMATVIDLRTLTDGLSSAQLLRAVATQMGIRNVEELDENHADAAIRQKAEQHYERINKALQTSSNFIRSEMNLPLPSKVADTRVASKLQLLSLLRKVSVYKKGEKGLDSHLAYCALIKGAIAALELETNAVAELEAEAQWLQNTLTVSQKDNTYTPLVITKPFGTNDDEIDGVLSGMSGGPVDVKFSMREKTWRSIMRKYLLKPESNAKEALKDALALRFKVDGTRPGTVARVMEYLREHTSAEFKMIANKGIIGREEFANLYSSLKKMAVGEGLQVDPTSNPKSAKGFSVLQLNGIMKLPPGGDLTRARGEWRERPFEIQFVDIKRKPNRDLASDAVYAFKKDIIIATRLLGSIKAEWLKDRAEKTAHNPDVSMNSSELLEALRTSGFIFKKPNSRDHYAATEVWARWLKIPGLINDPAIQHDVTHAMSVQNGQII